MHDGNNNDSVLKMVEMIIFSFMKLEDKILASSCYIIILHPKQFTFYRIFCNSIFFQNMNLNSHDF